MIQINLLPDEYKNAQRTPLRVFAAIALGVTINGSLGAWWLWNDLGPGAALDQRLEVLQGDQATLDPLVAYHKSLQAETRLYDSREATLDEIVGQRVSWTEKVDQLVDVINDGGTDETKYLVWLNNLNVTQAERSARGGTQATGGQLNAKANSGDGDFALAANFLEDVENSDFGWGFLPPAPVSGSASEADETLIPSVVFEFNLALELLPASERQKLEAEREAAEREAAVLEQEG